MNIPVVKIRPIKRKNKTAYQLDYMLNGKRIREIVAHNRRDAQIISAQRQQELTLGIHGIHPAGSRIISLKELIVNFLSSKQGTVRPTSYKRYENYFTVFEKFMYNYFSAACDDISKIKSIYLQQCFLILSKEKVTKSKPWHPNTINILRELLAEMFNQAMKNKYVSENPVDDTRPLDAPQVDKLQFYTKEQLTAIFENIDEKWQNFIKFLALTGLRKGEAIFLTWDNVSLDPTAPYVRITTTENFRPKGGKTQTIRITPQAVEILKAQQGKNKTYVFPGDNGGVIRKASPNEALEKALKTVGISGNIKMFRHTFASHFLMDRVGTLSDLMNYYGHSEIETTKIYAHLSQEYQEDIIKKLETSQNQFNERQEKK